MTFAGMNYLAIIAAAVASYIFGALWYNALAKPWMAALGVTPQDLKGPGGKVSPVPFVIAFLAQLVMAWMLAGVIGHLGPKQVTFRNGVISAAFLWFGEQANALRIAGLVLGVVAIACLVARPERGPRGGGWQAWALPLVVLVGYASVDVLLKRLAAAGTPFAASLQVAFVAAFTVMLCMQGARAWRTRVALTGAALGAGLLLGTLNFANILFYVKAHRALPDHPAVVFSMMNIGVVVLGTLVGVLGFGERLGRLNLLAIPLAIIAIGLIAAGIR